MPFKRRYKKKKKYTKRRPRKKSKWRQQRLAVGTVQKIAKKVAQKAILQDQAKEKIWYEWKIGNYDAVQSIVSITQSSANIDHRVHKNVPLPMKNRYISFPLVRCANQIAQFGNNTDSFPSWQEYVLEASHSEFDYVSGEAFQVTSLRCSVKLISPPYFRYAVGASHLSNRGQIPPIKVEVFLLKIKNITGSNTDALIRTVSNYNDAVQDPRLIPEVNVPMNRLKTQGGRKDYRVVKKWDIYMPPVVQTDTRRIKTINFNLGKPFKCRYDANLSAYFPQTNQYVLLFQTDSTIKEYTPSMQLKCLQYVRDLESV